MYVSGHKFVKWRRYAVNFGVPVCIAVLSLLLLEAGVRWYFYGAVFSAHTDSYAQQLRPGATRDPTPIYGSAVLHRLSGYSVHMTANSKGLRDEEHLCGDGSSHREKAEDASFVFGERISGRSFNRRAPRQGTLRDGSPTTEDGSPRRYFEAELPGVAPPLSSETRTVFRVDEVEENCPVNIARGSVDDLVPLETDTAGAVNEQSKEQQNGTGPKDSEDDAGRWGEPRPWETDTSLTDEQRAAFSELDAIGYLGANSPAPKNAEQTYHDSTYAFQGYNLYSSGHACQAILMDMDGQVLHTWQKERWEVWPDSSEQHDTNVFVHDDFWRRIRPLEHGDLIAIYEGFGVVKLDKDSNIIWKRRGGFHHDLDEDDLGRIVILGRIPRIIERYNKEKPILEDFVVVLSREGDELERVSILECFENSNYASVIAKIKGGDAFHTNTLEILDGRLADRSAAFKRGNVLLASRRLDAIFVIDMERRSVEWLQIGMWSQQHQPTVLQNSHMLIFDNNGLIQPREPERRSRVLEFDPFTQEIFWQYTGTADKPFYSDCCGTAERMPNGNTLITETERGRAFEVTSEGLVVWKYLNPHRRGENNELIANIFAMIRLHGDSRLDWLLDSPSS